ncbi:MAG TPA: signal peptidase I [Micromonosporaceae bacterium]|nr:signal peptidase I [Micromonosporaceae bacterium]
MIDEQTEKRPSSFWKELPILLGVALLVAFLVRTFVMQTFYIPSESMQHTLDLNDRVLVNKLVYDFRTPKRGEIIVFVAPFEWTHNPKGEDYIKRVIGVGGDTVKCCDEQGRLLINGAPLDEDYLLGPVSPHEFEITVPKGRLWVMGDNRASSGDSLQHWRNSKEDIMVGTVPEDRLVGRAFAIFWPLDRSRWLSVPDAYEAVPDP